MCRQRPYLGAHQVPYVAACTMPGCACVICSPRGSSHDLQNAVTAVVYNWEENNDNEQTVNEGCTERVGGTGGARTPQSVGENATASSWALAEQAPSQDARHSPWLGSASCPPPDDRYHRNLRQQHH